MSIVGALDVHRNQLTFDIVDLETGENRRGRATPADRHGSASGWRSSSARSSSRSRGAPAGGSWWRSARPRE